MTSDDSGFAWHSNSAPALVWNSVASSADGHNLVASASGAGIYRLQTSAFPLLNIKASGAGLLLSWTVPSQSFALQQNSVLASTNWTDVGSTSVLNLRTIQNEVTISGPGKQMFYRLAARP
jgi:hypothetical protein